MIFCRRPRRIATAPGRVTPDDRRRRADRGRASRSIEHAEYTILYSHGNAEDLGLDRARRSPASASGASRSSRTTTAGTGRARAAPSERGAYEDVDAAYAYLTRTLGVPPGRIIAYGRSVGSGPAVDLATRRPLAGLVVESGFVTAFRVMTRVPLLPFDKFRNIDKIGRVSCPVLVMHGDEDDIVPIAHGRRLFARGPGTQALPLGGGRRAQRLHAGRRRSPGPAPCASSQRCSANREPDGGRVSMRNRRRTSRSSTAP